MAKAIRFSLVGNHIEISNQFVDDFLKVYQFSLH